MNRLITVICKALEHLKEKAKTEGLMEDRDKTQWRIMHDRSCQTNLVSVFADIANIMDKGKREKS